MKLAFYGMVAGFLAAVAVMAIVLSNRKGNVSSINKSFWSQEELRIGNYILHCEDTGFKRSSIFYKDKGNSGFGELVVPPSVFILDVSDGWIVGVREKICKADESFVADGAGQMVEFPSPVYFCIDVEKEQIYWFEDRGFTTSVTPPAFSPR
jgi:hypothetical protein